MYYSSVEYSANFDMCMYIIPARQTSAPSCSVGRYVLIHSVVVLCVTPVLPNQSPALHLYSTVSRHLVSADVQC